jgi:hypothetical protein
MNIFRKIILGLFVFFTLACLGLYIFIQIEGKVILQSRLRALIRDDVTVGDVRFIFPFGLRVDGLKIPGVLEAAEVRGQIGFATLIEPRVVISHLIFVDPVLYLRRTRDSRIRPGEIDDPVDTADKPKVSVEPALPGPASAPTTARGPKRPRTLWVDWLEVKNGQLIFRDFSRDRDLRIMLNALKLKAQNFRYPLAPGDMKYLISGIWQTEDFPFSGSSFEANGTVDFIDRDMDSSLKVVEPNGRTALRARLVSKHNDLTVTGTMDIRNLTLVKTKKKEGTFSVDDFIMGALQSSGIEIEANFAIRSKMDNFQPDSISFSGDVGIGGPEKSSGSIKEDLKNFGKEFYEKNIKSIVAPDETPVDGSMPATPSEQPVGNAIQPAGEGQ